MAKPKLNANQVENSEYDNTVSGLTATDVKAAIDELVVTLASKLARGGELTLDSFNAGLLTNYNKISLPAGTGKVSIRSGTDASNNCTVLFGDDAIDISFDGGAVEYHIRQGGATDPEDIIKKDYLDVNYTAPAGGQLGNVIKSDTTGITANPIYNIVSILQADYDLIPVKAANTFYLVEDASSNYEDIVISCSNLVDNLTTGADKAYFRMPYAATIAPFENPPAGSGVISVKASVKEIADTDIIVDIKHDGDNIFSTPLRIDAGDKTSKTSATTPVIIGSSLLDDSEITVDLSYSAAPGTPGKGLIVYIKVIKN